MQQRSRRCAPSIIKNDVLPDTVVFDLDGTLYEDVSLYDRYAHELSRFLPDRYRKRFFADWEAARRGDGMVQIGLGYDDERGRLFRYESGRIVAYLDWEGEEQAHPSSGQTPRPNHVLFADSRLNVGDWWGVLQVLAARYGVTTEQRNAAFTATRGFMSTDDWKPSVERDLIETLDALRRQGVQLVTMTNSPEATTANVLARLGLGHLFTLIIASAQKPSGLAHFMDEHAPASRHLAVGDHFVNDIEPALEAGARALYIDRHRTGLGGSHHNLERVCSIAEVPPRLRASFRHAPH